MIKLLNKGDVNSLPFVVSRNWHATSTPNNYVLINFVTIGECSSYYIWENVDRNGKYISGSIYTTEIMSDYIVPEDDSFLFYYSSSYYTTQSYYQTASHSEIHILGGLSPYTVSVISGSLPSGITISTGASSIIFDGTPQESGDFYFDIQLTDKNGCTAEKSLYINVNQQCLELFGKESDRNDFILTEGGKYFATEKDYLVTNSTFSTTGKSGSAFLYTLNIISGQSPYTTSLVPLSGSLPNGISMATDSSYLYLNGIPTTIGIYNFIIDLADSNGCTQYINGKINITS